MKVSFPEADEILYMLSSDNKVSEVSELFLVSVYKARAVKEPTIPVFSNRRAAITYSIAALLQDRLRWARAAPLARSSADANSSPCIKVIAFVHNTIAVVTILTLPAAQINHLSPSMVSFKKTDGLMPSSQRTI